MITTHEKQRLMQQYRTDPLATKATALKSIVCVGALAAVALIGLQARDDAGSTTGARQANVSASIADTRKVMEQRRERFERREHASSGAFAAPLPDETAGGREREPAIDEMMLLRRSSD